MEMTQHEPQDGAPGRSSAATQVGQAALATRQPLVSVVLLNWNGWHDTLECLESLGALTYPRLSVIVVDNGSTDGSEERIRAAHPEVTLLQSGANLGFAGGNNIGIRYALDHAADYVWLLNNDTLVLPDTLTTLVARAESDLTLGFVGSKILLAGDHSRVWFGGGSLATASGITQHVGGGALDDDRVRPAQLTDYANGCSVLARRATIEQVGVIPEVYFLYYEEVDWQYSGRAYGWRAFYEPASVVYHKVSASVGEATPFQVFYLERGRAIFVLRHLPHALIPSTLFWLRYLLVRHLVHRRWGLAWASVRGLAAGLRDGLRLRRALRSGKEARI